MASNKNNWQDFAKDLGLSFEIDPNAPELPLEPEVVVLEPVVAAEVVAPHELDPLKAGTDESGVETISGPDGIGEPEDSGEPKRRRRVRKRRGSREEPEGGNSSETPEETLPEDGEGSQGRELVGAVAGTPDNGLQAASRENPGRHPRHHHHDEEIQEDEEPFVLEDLSNLSLPNWTELIDSLYRPDR